MYLASMTPKVLRSDGKEGMVDPPFRHAPLQRRQLKRHRSYRQHCAFSEVWRGKPPPLPRPQQHKLRTVAHLCEDWQQRRHRPRRQRHVQLLRHRRCRQRRPRWPPAESSARRYPPEQQRYTDQAKPSPDCPHCPNDELDVVGRRGQLGTTHLCKPGHGPLLAVTPCWRQT